MQGLECEAGKVFVFAEDGDPCDHEAYMMDAEQARLEGRIVIKCHYCSAPAEFLDSAFPYQTDYNFCGAHKKAGTHHCGKLWNTRKVWNAATRSYIREYTVWCMACGEIKTLLRYAVPTLTSAQRWFRDYGWRTHARLWFCPKCEKWRKERPF